MDQSLMAGIRKEARGAAREPDGGTPGSPSKLKACLANTIYLCSLDPVMAFC